MGDHYIEAENGEETFRVQVIPFDEWPDEFFPTNCWGVVYIMSQFVRNKLIQVKIWIRDHRVVKIAGWYPPRWSHWLTYNLLNSRYMEAQPSVSVEQP